MFRSMFLDLTTGSQFEDYVATTTPEDRYIMMEKMWEEIESEMMGGDNDERCIDAYGVIGGIVQIDE